MEHKKRVYAAATADHLDHATQVQSTENCCRRRVNKRKVKSLPRRLRHNCFSFAFASNDPHRKEALIVADGEWRTLQQASSWFGAQEQYVCFFCYIRVDILVCQII